MTLQHLGRVLVFPVVSVCMSVWCPITFIIIRSSLTLRRGGVQRQLSRIMEQRTRKHCDIGGASQGRCNLLCCITIIYNIYNNVVYHNRYIYLLLPNQPNQWLVLHIKISEQKHLLYSWHLFAYMNAKASWGSRMFFSSRHGSPPWLQTSGWKKYYLILEASPATWLYLLLPKKFDLSRPWDGWMKILFFWEGSFFSIQVKLWGCIYLLIVPYISSIKNQHHSEGPLLRDYQPRFTLPKFNMKPENGTQE